MPRRNKHGGRRVYPGDLPKLQIMHIEACVKAFKAECAYQRFCQHPRCENPGNWRWQAHHVVTEAIIRRDYTEEPQTVWHADNALRLCEDCHNVKHHKRLDPVPVAALRTENFDYAVELMGPGPAYEYLHRTYPGEDPRLQQILAMWEKARIR